MKKTERAFVPRPGRHPAPGSWSILPLLPRNLGRQESWGLFPEGQGGWGQGQGQGQALDKQIKGEVPSQPEDTECNMRWVEAPRTSLARVWAESRPHRPCPAVPSGCCSSWACCGAQRLRPRGRSGPSPCSGAWHRPASPTSTPTTRSGAGP